MNTFKSTRKAALRLALSVLVVGLFAVPQVNADSSAGSAASTETGGPQQTQSTSNSTTQSTTQSGGATNGNSVSQSTTQNSTTAETKNESSSGDGPIGRSMAERTVKTTGVQVRTSPVQQKTVSSRTTTVRAKKKPAWKTVTYSHGKRTVIK